MFRNIMPRLRRFHSSRASSLRRQAGLAAQRRFRPLLEQLEERTLFATQLLLSGFTAATAGTPETLTVRAIDANGQTDTTYNGTIRFSSNDHFAMQLGGLPADYTFQPLSDQGVRTFSVTFYKSGIQSLTATDVGDSTLTGSLTVNQTVSVFSQPPNLAGGYYKSSWYAPGEQGMDGDQYAYDDFTLSSTQTINEIAWRGCYTNYLSGAGKSPQSATASYSSTRRRESPSLAPSRLEPGQAFCTAITTRWSTRPWSPSAPAPLSTSTTTTTR